MTDRQYDFTVFDESGDVLVELKDRYKLKRFLAFYKLSISKKLDIDYYSSSVDPLTLSDTISAASAAKLDFLHSADSSIVTVKGMRGLELYSTAWRLLLENEIKNLIVISDFDKDTLVSAAENDEMERTNFLIAARRLVYANTLPYDITDSILCEESLEKSKGVNT